MGGPAVLLTESMPTPEAPVPSSGPVVTAARAPRAVLRELTRPFAPARGGRVLVAVSGGADSVALLHLLAALAPGRGWSLVVASLDHGLRGDAGAADVAFVAGLAGGLGIPFVAGRADAPRPRGASPEEAARDARLGFLREAASRHGAAAVALGHTADDQAETVLYRLARGAGRRGLAGMRRWAPPFWRPLLGVRRADLRDLLAAAGLPWREDPTNDSDAFARNRIRHEVLPALERAVGPGAVPALARSAALAAEDEAVLEEAARAASAVAITREDASGIELERRAVMDLPPAVSRRILRGCCERLAGTTQAVSAAHLAALLSLVRADTPGTRADLPRGLTARRQGRKLVIARSSAVEGR